MRDFVISGIETGKLNALVKNIMRKTGIEDPREAVRMVNAGKVEIFVIKPTLSRLMGVRFTLSERHDPDAFYQTRKGLCVSDGFLSEVVENAVPSEKGTTFKVDRFKLMEDLTDDEIEDSLDDPCFYSTELCAIIAELIAEQPNGEHGVLLNNGHVNVFYTSSCVVVVRWLSDDHEWLVRTWQRADDRWYAGDQVFDPATTP